MPGQCNGFQDSKWSEEKARKAPAVTVREATRADIPTLVELNRASYPTLAEDNVVWRSEHLAQHQRVFPQGQLVAEVGGQDSGSVLFAHR